MEERYLHTFGAAYVRGASGEPLTGAAAQRRTLALLSLLSVAGAGGLSRDRLVALLWPDADAERGRHSLTQALYGARRALRVDDLFVVGADIRLNPERIASDVQQFEAAIAAGDLEGAIATYRGPFLDGFYLTGAADFEQWASAQRERLETLAVRALEALATGAEEREDFAGAVAWRRQLAALRPLDSGAAVKLMTALARSGDRASALQHARVHEALLRDQLGLEPEPAVTALAERLREPVEWSPAVVPALPAAAPAAPAAPRAVAGGEAVAGDDHDGAGTPRVAAFSPPAGTAVGVWLPSTRRRIWLARGIAALVVVVMIGIGFLFGRGGRESGRVVSELPVRQRVVVAPFRVAGADPSLAYLRDGMVELLATRLADDSAARSVDAGAVLGAWRTAGLTGTMDVPRDTLVDLAARLGAERVVVGSVVGSPASLILRATVIPVATGTPSAEATVTGPADSLTTLIDRLAARLLTSEAGEDALLAQQTTTSLPALRAFLAGQAAFRAADHAAALRSFEDALRRDTTFGLAAVQAAISADRLFDAHRVRRYVALAWPYRDDLSERDRGALYALVGARFPAPSTRAEVRAAWQRLADRAPQSADAWHLLGTRLLRDGAALGVTASESAAADAFRRALAGGGGPAAHGMLELIGAEPYDPSNATPAAIGPFAPLVRWRVALVRGDSGELARVRDTLYRLGPANLRALAMMSQYDSLGADDGARALELLARRDLRNAERVDVLLAQHAAAMIHGRPRDALAIVARLQRLQPGTFAAARLHVLDFLYGDGDSASAATAMRELAAVSSADGMAARTTSETWSANLCVIGQWLARHGDVAGTGRTASALRSVAAFAPGAVLSASPSACAELLEAERALLGRAPDAKARLLRLDSLAWTPQVVGDLAMYAPLALARLHERSGDVAAALGAARRTGYLWGWPRYRATLLREEARLAERAGDLQGMRAALARYAALRDSGDVATQPALAAVRRRLDRDPRARP